MKKLAHRVDGGPWSSVAGAALLSLVALNNSFFFFPKGKSLKTQA